MTEEKKDSNGIDPEASEPKEESQVEVTGEEHKEESATEGALTGQASEETPGEITEETPEEAAELKPQTEEPEVVEHHDEHAIVDAAAEENTEAAEVSKKQGSSQVWIGISLLLAVLLVISLFKSPFSQQDSEKAVASVNNAKITKDQLYNALVKAGGAQTLSGMIDDELIRQEAEKGNVQVTDADVQKEKDFYITQFGSEDALKQLLSQYGMSDDDFQKQLHKEAQIRKILEPKITVTDDQIKQYFNENKQKFDTPAEVRASEIVVGTEAEAKDIIKQLQGGTDFATLAKDKSTADTKDNGGDLGFFPNGSGANDPALEKAAFALKKDEISDPIKLQDGTYVVVKVTDTKEAHSATLDEKKDEIKDVLVTQQVSSMSSSWLDDLRSKAQITNTLDNSADAAAGDPTTGQ